MKAIVRFAGARGCGCVIAGLSLLSGCAPQPIVPASDRFTLGTASFAPPPGAGWMQLERGTEHVVFGKREAAIGSAGATIEAAAVDLTAWIKVVRATRPVTSYAALHAIVVRMTDQLDRNRFELHHHVVEPVDTPAAICVRRSMRLDDLRASPRRQGTSGTASAMRMVDTLCSDPSRPHTFYAIHISERAERLRPIDIALKLAEQWLAGVRFGAATDHAP